MITGDWCGWSPSYKQGAVYLVKGSDSSWRGMVDSESDELNFKFILNDKDWVVDRDYDTVKDAQGNINHRLTWKESMKISVSMCELNSPRFAQAILDKEREDNASREKEEQYKHARQKSRVAAILKEEEKLVSLRKEQDQDMKAFHPLTSQANIHAGSKSSPLARSITASFPAHPFSREGNLQRGRTSPAKTVTLSKTILGRTNSLKQEEVVEERKDQLATPSGTASAAEPPTTAVPNVIAPGPQSPVNINARPAIESSSSSTTTSIQPPTTIPGDPVKEKTSSVEDSSSAPPSVSSSSASPPPPAHTSKQVPSFFKKIGDLFHKTKK